MLILLFLGRHIDAKAASGRGGAFGEGVTDIEATQFRLRHKGFCSPFYIHEDKLIFLQADWTLTVLDLPTGDVIKRDTTFRQYNIERHLVDLPVAEWNTFGNLLWGRGGWRTTVVVSLPEWRLDISSAYIMFKEHRPLFYGSRMFLRTNDDMIVSIDSISGAKMELCTIGEGTFDIMDGKVFAFIKENRWDTMRKVACFSADDGRLLWEKIAPSDQFWEGGVCLDSKVYVFGAPVNAAGTPQRRSGFIYTFSPEGRQIDMAESGILGLGSPLNPDFTFMRRKFDYGRLEPDDGEGPLRFPNAFNGKGEDIAEKRLGRVPGICITQQSDGSVAGIDFDMGRLRPAGAKTIEPGKCHIYFIDGDSFWEGRANPILGMVTHRYGFGRLFLHHDFPLAVTENYVVYGGSNGKVECLDRATGRSLWLYSFSGMDCTGWRAPGLGRFSVGKWQYWGESFYVEDRRWYEREYFSTTTLSGTEIFGDPVPPSTRFVVDPAPDPFPTDNALLAALLSWSVAIGMLLANVALVVPLLRIEPTETGPPSFLERLRHKGAITMYGVLIVLVVSLASYFVLGRYSMTTTILFLLNAAAALFVGVYFILHPTDFRKPWFDGFSEGDGRRAPPDGARSVFGVHADE